jgi:uncharacterized membrane protein
MVTILEVAITVLCGVGLYASLFMLAKSRRADRGLLAEPSVVQSPRARLYGGVPNAALGVAYYVALAAAVWLVRSRAGAIAVLLAAAFAAVTSLVLAYSLLFVTKRACSYCWTSHAVNWLLAVLTMVIQNYHIEYRRVLLVESASPAQSVSMTGSPE